jgi:hypothetical protein
MAVSREDRSEREGNVLVRDLLGRQSGQTRSTGDATTRRYLDL